MAAKKGKAADPRRRVIIYAWVCPDTGRPVYVGKTSQTLGTRQRSHRREATKKSRTPKHLWLRDLLAAGKVPEIVELERCSVEASSFVERVWIRLLDERFELLNLSPGGGGNPGVGRVRWTPELTALLGVIHDPELAALAGCDRGTVAYRRTVLGIAACPDRELPPNTVTLSEDIIARLGSVPDYILAKEIGISKFVISKHRRRLGILPCATSTGQNGTFKSGEPHRRWRPKSPDLLAEIAAQLGTMTDEALAKRYGLSKSFVHNMRRSQGIESYFGKVRTRKWAPRRRRKNVGYNAGPPAQAGFSF